MAPEILRGKRYGFAVDWWALGVVLSEMAFGATPFFHDKPRELMRLILSEAPCFPESDDGGDVHELSALRWTAAALLEKAPRDRLGRRGGAAAVRGAPAFAAFDFGAIERRERPPPGFRVDARRPDDAARAAPVDLDDEARRPDGDSWASDPDAGAWSGASASDSDELPLAASDSDELPLPAPDADELPLPAPDADELPLPAPDADELPLPEPASPAEASARRVVDDLERIGLAEL